MSTVVDVEDPPRPPMDPTLRQRRIEVRREEGRRRLRPLLFALGVLGAMALVWALTYSSLGNAAPSAAISQPATAASSPARSTVAWMIISEIFSLMCPSPAKPFASATSWARPTIIGRP